MIFFLEGKSSIIPPSVTLLPGDRPESPTLQVFFLGWANAGVISGRSRLLLEHGRIIPFSKVVIVSPP